MNQPIYINGSAAISIQDTLKGFFPNDFVKIRQRFAQAIDPDFKEHIPVALSRRMSRMIKRAITVSQLSLQEAKVVLPDAIIFGTGLGCIEDTEKFLNAVLDQDEVLLPPGFFIQSTHNTITSQVAMRLGCHGYNNTFVQRGLSFESALLDASLLFDEGRVATVLTGGHDELTPTYFTLLDKVGYYSYNEKYDTGSFAGEGSVSFVLDVNRKEESYASIHSLEMFYCPQKDTTFKSVVEPFLDRQGVSPNELCALFTAYTDDETDRRLYQAISTKPFSEIPHIPYKKFCGVYFTSSAFGLWLAAHYLRSGAFPDDIRKPYILLHNHSFNKFHSIMLLKNLNR